MPARIPQKSKSVTTTTHFSTKSVFEELGTAPITNYLQAIDKLANHDEVGAFLGNINPDGIGGPFNLYVGQDDKEATRYILHFLQSGLGLPDRDYYTDESERGQEIIGRYKQYLSEMLKLAGIGDVENATQRYIQPRVEARRSTVGQGR